MIWDRVGSLYIDVDAMGGNPLLDGKTNAALTVTPTFIQGDAFLIRLYFRRKSANTGGASAAIEQNVSDNIVLAGKATAQIAASELLFSVSSFETGGAGDDLCYQGILSLDSAAMRSAMSSVSSLPVTIDVEVQNTDNTERATFQFAAIIKKQAYNNESTPTPAAPLYPAPNQLMLKHADGASIVFSEGKHPYLYCAETGLFHPLVLKLVDGHIVIASSDEGVINP